MIIKRKKESFSPNDLGNIGFAIALPIISVIFHIYILLLYAIPYIIIILYRYYKIEL